MNLYDHIPDIMERFNFENVHKTMTMLGWTWQGRGVPTIEELRESAYAQLTGCIDEFEKRGRPKCGMLYATGGFQAMIFCFGDEPELQLVFYVDSARARHYR